MTYSCSLTGLKITVGFEEQGLRFDVLGTHTLHAVKECQVWLPKLM